MRSNNGKEKTINLDLVEELQNDSIVTFFVANRQTVCLEAKLNHVYSNRSLVSRVYPDWIKTVDMFVTRAAQKGISQPHIKMLTDSLDNNHQKVLDFIFEDDETRRGVNALALIKSKILDIFLDETKTPYSAVKIGDHVETVPLESRKFEDWAGSIYYNYKKDYLVCPSTLSKQQINEIQGILRFETFCSVSDENDSPTRGQNIRTLHVRVAAFVDAETENLDDNYICYDLCNSNWEFIKVTRHGWEILKQDENNIIFKRFAIMNPQVHPRRDYPSDILDQFMKLINIDGNDEDTKLLAIVYIIALFILAGLPKPMLNPNGPHGSGKSTYQEYVKLIVDPAAALTTAFPDKLAELVQVLSHNYVIFFDNVSSISEITSDQLCRAVTGSGFVKRSLYTNDEDVIYNMRRAVGYNGINVTAHKADLLDRLLNLRLKHIDKNNRKKLSQLQKDFDRILPYLLGYIFDLLVKVLGRVGEVKLKELPRMADFAEMGELISRCLVYPNDKFTEAYNRNIGQTNDEVLNSNLVATAITLLLSKQRVFAGRASELLAKFNDLALKNAEVRNIVNHKWWPKTPKALSNKITEIEPNLKEIGIIVERIEDKHSKSARFLVTNLKYSSEAFEENGGG